MKKSAMKTDLLMKFPVGLASLSLKDERTDNLVHGAKHRASRLGTGSQE
jgi:hypothetical protein